MSVVARTQGMPSRWSDLQPRGVNGGAPVRVPILAERDVVGARSEARAFATQLGFSTSEVTAIVAVISELARTVSAETSEGALVLRCSLREEDLGIEVEAHFGTAQPKLPRKAGGELVGIDRSLTAVRRLVDAFEMTSKPGGGTIVRVIKWMR